MSTMIPVESTTLFSKVMCIAVCARGIPALSVTNVDDDQVRRDWASIESWDY